uniref:B-box zinc finger family-like protein n=1 Tax=Adineta vaga TaxID=104782 RepID=B3G4C3_ADIVA|nr:B-box zinc finger family-like protein [Adineta vaga]
MTSSYTEMKENVEVKDMTRSVEKFVGDTLMTDEQKFILNYFYGRHHQYWKLIYKTTRDGSDSISFHRLCDNQGPTMTLIQSTTNCLFGDYASKCWQSSSSFVDASESFLYLLTNANGNLPTKFPYNNDRKALYNFGSYGPIFGGEADLYISGRSNICLCSYCSLGVSYVNSFHLGVNTFTGSQYFQTNEIEIFKLS